MGEIYICAEFFCEMHEVRPLTVIFAIWIVCQPSNISYKEYEISKQSDMLRSSIYKRWSLVLPDCPNHQIIVNKWEGSFQHG